MKKRNYRNIIFRMALVASISIFMFACSSDPQSPGVEYMPDMYRSPALEPYVSYPGWRGNNGRGYGSPLEMYSRHPVDGTIPRGFTVYHLNPSDSDYFQAGKFLHSPLDITKKTLEKGQFLFDTFCAVCHGKDGKGDGTLTAAVYKGVPDYTDTSPNRRGGSSMHDLSGGKIFHVMTFGLNAMGSYASQVSKKERWEIVAYVHKLQGGDSIKGQDKSSEDSDEQKEKTKSK